MNEITLQYLSSLLSQDDGMHRLKLRMQEKEIPVVTDEVLRLIEVFIHASSVRSILEIGTAVGVSSMFFASFMGQDGRITSIERDDHCYMQALKNIEDMGFSEQISVLHADATDILKRMDDSYDMIFLDGAKAHYIHMLDDCVRLLRPGGILVADNVLFRGMVSGEIPLRRRKITIVKRMRLFLEAISTRSDLKTDILPIGDGVSISVRIM
ncbi:MAG: O-methyltransferase [Anaerofustis sp.]